MEDTPRPQVEELVSGNYLWNPFSGFLIMRFFGEVSAVYFRRLSTNTSQDDQADAALGSAEDEAF